MLMLKYDFEESVGFWLATAHQAYMRSFQQQLGPQGLTFRQAQVLGWLVARGPLSQRELAEQMLIEPSNLVGVLDRMEQAGLVERRPCDFDARKKLVHILPGAEDEWRKIAECGRRVRKQATAGLSKADQTHLKKLLERVRLNLGALDPVEA
ncbi:MAG: MarR family transcriptional regulator [Planctomycetota bacterium]